jgi:hypothetical protein
MSTSTDKDTLKKNLIIKIKAGLKEQDILSLTNEITEDWPIDERAPALALLINDLVVENVQLYNEVSKLKNKKKRRSILYGKGGRG